MISSLFYRNLTCTLHNKISQRSNEEIHLKEETNGCDYQKTPSILQTSGKKERSRMTRIIRRASSRQEKRSVWYKKYVQDLQRVFNILETRDRESFRESMKEDPQIKLKKSTRPKKTEAANYRAKQWYS